MEEQLSPWQRYKKNLGETRPWDMVNPNVEHVSEDTQQARYSMCLECPELINLTKQCKKCGCLMPMKTKLKHAECPVGKWGKDE
jgi:hypothetical protein